MKRVFASPDRAAVEIVRQLLREAGIGSTVFNESTGAILGDIPFFVANPEVWILYDDQEADARQVVHDFETGEARDRLDRRPWRCPTCGEQIEGQFSQCWRCTEMPD